MKKTHSGLAKFMVCWMLIIGGANMADLSAQATEIVPASMPVTRVVLYSSGVGFFEHAGTVDGDALARFTFKTDQINDVLKSMVLRDFGGGSATAVNYASQDPIARALRSFAIDLSDKPSMAVLLDRLRGAAVTLMAPQAISGTILGIEQNYRVVVQNGQSINIPETTLNLLTTEGLRAIPLSTVSVIKLADARLNDELNRALALIIDAADTQRKTVDVRFSGKGNRKVAVDYVAEAPVWKTSYRLDLSSAVASGTANSGKGKTTASGSADPKAFIQGWAIIENSSDADWKGISLSLVSGSPVSFTMDLYTPLYVQRPDVAPMVQAAVQAHSYAEGSNRNEVSGMTAAPAPAPILSRSKAAMAQPSSEDYMAADESEINLGGRSAAVPTANAGKFGEMFNFSIKTPVSLPRRQSSMLPLINQEIEAEKVSIYNQAALAHNPLAGARIINSSGLRLPPGPITVFDAGMYAGDALLETFGANDKRLISYAIDLDVQVDASSSSSSTYTKISIVRGVLNIQRVTSWVQKYHIENKAGDAKVLLIEHPKTRGRDLLSPGKFFEETDQLWRFRVDLPKLDNSDFTVTEQQSGTETIALLNAQPTAFLYYNETGKSSPALKAALQKAADLKQKQSKLQMQVADLTRQKVDIENGQPRLRANIETVGRDSPQGQRYLQKLLEGEDAIDKLTNQIQAAQDQARQAQSELENYLKNLAVE